MTSDTHHETDNDTIYDVTTHHEAEDDEADGDG